MRPVKNLSICCQHVVDFFFLGSEFKKSTREWLQRHNVRQYYTHAGIWPKCAPIEVHPSVGQSNQF